MTDLAECTGCRVLGKCCWTAVTLGEHDSGRSMRVYSRVPCPVLDTETGLCGDYENRSKVPWCVAHWNQIEGAGSDVNNTPHWCPNNDPVGALMIDATHYFRISGGAPDKLGEFLERIDKLAIDQMEEKYGDQGWAVDLRTVPTNPATPPVEKYKKLQQLKKQLKERRK